MTEPESTAILAGAEAEAPALLAEMESPVSLMEAESPALAEADSPVFLALALPEVLEYLSLKVKTLVFLRLLDGRSLDTDRSSRRFLSFLKRLITGVADRSSRRSLSFLKRLITGVADLERLGMVKRTDGVR